MLVVHVEGDATEGSHLAYTMQNVRGPPFTKMQSSLLDVPIKARHRHNEQL